MRRFTIGALVSLLATVALAPVAFAAKIETHKTGKHVAAKKAVAFKVKPSLKSAAKHASRVKNPAQVKVVRLNFTKSKHRTGFQHVAYASALSGVPPLLTAGDLAGLNLTRDPLDLKSNVALVLDQATNEVLFEKNAEVALPIASITKLMTSLVVVEADQDLEELLAVTEDDVDREKFSHSRLRVGSQLTRANMLHIALMSSENRAASSLGRHYPGGLSSFVRAMNSKATELGMNMILVEDLGWFGM